MSGTFMARLLAPRTMALSPVTAEVITAIIAFTHIMRRAPATPTTTVEAACGGLAPGVANLPIDQIEKAVRPTEAQIALLNDLRSALAQADNVLRASCTTEIPLTPVGRLDAMTKRIEAMKKAVQMIREPLAKFYDALDPRQKERFAAIGATRRATAGKARKNSTVCALAKRRTSRRRRCSASRKRSNRPNSKRSAFDELKKVSTTAAKDLEASCPGRDGQDRDGAARHGGEAP